MTSENPNAPEQKPTEAVTPQENAAQKGTSAQIKPPVVLEIPPAPPNPEKTRECRYEGAQGWKKILEIVAVVAGILYAIVAYCQWREMIKATTASEKSAGAAKIAADTAKDTLIRANRAWVGLGHPITPSSFRLSPKVSVQAGIPVKNFGHSVALKVMATLEPVNQENLHKRAPHVCDLILRFVNGTIPQNQLRGPQIRRGFTLFPGQEIVEGITTGDDTIKPESVDTLYFLGCIAYIDQFNQTRTTRFCVETPWLAKSFRIGQSLTSCSVYNEAD